MAAQAATQYTLGELLLRQQTIVDQLALRFSRIVTTVAGDPEQGEDVTAQRAATQSFEVNVQTQALIHAAEDFLKFTRELKELWLFGPLRELGEGEEEGKMDETAQVVAGMVEKLIAKSKEMN